MSLSYVIREGFAGFKRARFSAFSSIIAITLAVILFSVLIRVSFNAYDLAQTIKQDVQVEVFLKDMDSQQTTAMYRRIQTYDIVEEVTYISKEDVMEEFMADFGPGSEIFGGVQFLPASFRIKTKPDVNVAAITGFVDEIAVWSGIDEVQFNQRGLELLEERINLFIIGGGVLGLFIGFVAMVLVFNTIRLTIYAKRDLIKAMKLVGATNGFIKRPFMMEGILQGMIAWLIATGFAWLVFHVLIPVYSPQIGVMAWPLGRWYYLTAAMLVVGILMGFLGSRWAARKFISQTSVS